MDKFDDFFNEIFNSFFKDFDSTWGHKRISYNNMDPEKLDGDHKVEEGEKDGVKWRQETWNDGNGSYMRSVSYNYIYKPTNKETTNKEPSKEEPSKEELQKKLKLAIKEERYEDAAEIRDKIKSLEKGE